MKLLMIALLFSAISASVCYSPITKFDAMRDRGISGPAGDVAQYVRMYRGVPLDSIPKPFRYRVLVPALARLVPDLPAPIARLYEIDEQKKVSFRFGVVSVFGLTLTAFVLFAFLQALGFVDSEALIGSLLYFCSFDVLNYAGYPLVDSWAHAFLVTGALAIMRENRPLLALSSLLGMLTKETISLLVLYALLLSPRGRRLGDLVAVVPGLAAYVLLRTVLLPTEVGYNYTFEFMRLNLARFDPVPFAIDLALSFGPLWILAAYGLSLMDRKTPLARVAWSVPALLVIPVVIGASMARTWFYAFPIVIPLALLALVTILNGKRDPLVPSKAEPPD